MTLYIRGELPRKAPLSELVWEGVTLFRPWDLGPAGRPRGPWGTPQRDGGRAATRRSQQARRAALARWRG